ncbi:MAG: DNA primase [Sulfurovaceae bacterium]|nr:DNA primase [Sulfurovaceae bacterium]
MIDTASIEMLKNTIDIVDVIGNYIELKKAGANYKACCPFHGENTPSFVVSPNKQIYHCFGCGVGGDSIKFVMELEKLSYPEAVEKLATMFNVSLIYSEVKGDYSEAKRVLEAMQTWYVKNLSHANNALSYLHNRGINQNSIETFGIGFVPSGSEVMNFLHSTFIPLGAAEEAGVIATGEDGRYARLVERITFPIYSTSGGLVGFGGRTISNHPAKYINSPQTKLFNKSRLLYGYHQAKEHIYESRKIIICEGYLDVIMLHQGGFKEAVATLGTALTNEHLPLLRKGEPKVILAYDGDKAGIAAALKAAQMLSIAGFDGGVVLFPNGQDPADLIAKNESGLVAKLFREYKPHIEFVIEKLSSGYDLSNPKEKESAFGVIRSFLGGLSDVLQESYIPFAASTLGVSAALFGKGKKVQRLQTVSSQTKYDIEQLSLLKTLLEYPRLINDVLDMIHPKMFGIYEEYFHAVISGDNEHQLVRQLLLNENAKVMSETDLQKALRNFLIKYYKDKRKSIMMDNTVSMGRKILLNNKICKEIIPKLERGEIVEYESIGII